MLTSVINKLMQHKDLSAFECQQAVNQMVGSNNAAQAAAFLTLLHSKPETADELNGFVTALKQEMISVPTPTPTLDIVGTGGDGANTVNISSAASLVVASLGVTVAKHGNRSVSSKCGSADFFEALGVDINLPIENIQASLANHNFAFLYAPNFQPLMSQFKQLRNELKTRTTFNLVGPLLNPTHPDFYLLGVYDKRLLPIYADILIKSKIKRALVVHSCGTDEISLLGKTDIIEVNGETKKQYSIDVHDFAMQHCELKDLQGDDAETNKNLILKALKGEPSPIRDTIILNAGAALYASMNAKSIQEGVAKAANQIKSGKVILFIDTLTNYYNNLEAQYA